MVGEITNLVCDNKKCDYVSHNFPHKHLKELINTRCPKCTANLLTLDDYDNFQEVVELGKIVEELCKK